MKKNHDERLLKLWKIRQIQEGHDVSGVHSLEEAEHFFDKKVDESVEVPVDESVEVPVDESVEVPGAIIEEVALEDMTKAELIAYAKASGLKVDSSMKKAEIIEVIEGM